MSWKAVEMQVGLPRTQDAGKIQEQLQQRGQFMQDMLASAQVQSDEVKRKTVNELEQKKQVKNDKQKQQEEEKQPHSHLAKTHGNTPEHPYLGKKIDING